MKLAFTMLQLLVISTYLAVNIVCLQETGTGWMNVAFLMWLAILIVAALQAAQQSSRATVFSRGFLLVLLVYGAATFVNGMVTFGQPPLPHVYFAQIIPTLMTWAGRAPSIDPFEAGAWGLNLYLVAFQNVTLAVGILGGCVAVWRHRRLELLLNDSRSQDRADSATPRL